MKKIVKSKKQSSLRYWENTAKKLLWLTPWKKVLSWKSPHAQWFVGGKTNITLSALDVHQTPSRRSKKAIIWEGENGDVRTRTYKELLSETSQYANALQSIGVKKGDVVAIYMGMIPEAIAIMLACARIGAVHNVVFAGFSSTALRDRIIDSRAKYVVCSDGSFRKGTLIDLKQTVDAALKGITPVKKVVVVSYAKNSVTMKNNRDVWLHHIADTQTDECPPASLPAEHPLFYLYTSGSTGKPKGIVHTTGGYMVGAYATTKTVFQLTPKDVYWCTADIGWITGHTYVVYGPLLLGATVFMYEGALHYPDWGRVWKMIEQHNITVLYTAPTAIRSFIKAGDAWIKKYTLKSLRLLGSVGEPINPDVWNWYHRVVGKGHCPIVDTWWQTETGSIMISPVPGKTTLVPGSATKPLPGILVDVVNEKGKTCPPNTPGYLIVKEPWPSMLRTILHDDARYKKTYWSQYKGSYFTGDAAKRDKKGNIWIIGRVDDVVNVSGHRLGTAEVESALVSHASVAEAAVVAREDVIKGNALVAFVSLRQEFIASDTLRESIRKHVGATIGPIAKPDDVHFVDGLPKTRSGKIIRRLLREFAQNGIVSGDMTTLEDRTAIDTLQTLKAPRSK